MKLIGLLITLLILDTTKAENSNNNIRLSRSILSNQLNKTATIQPILNNGTISNIQNNTTDSNVKNKLGDEPSVDPKEHNGTTLSNQNNETVVNPSSTSSRVTPQIIATSSNAQNNGTTPNMKNIETKQDNRTKLIQSIITNLTSQLPDAKESIESSFNNLNLENQTAILKNLDFISRAANKTLFSLSPDLIKEFNESGINTEVWRNQVRRISNRKNVTDLNFNPSMWMLRTSAPWKHVSEAKRDNETEIVQICKFDAKTAICSAEYSKWNAKLWFDFAEAEGKEGINITTHERGRKPRVSFYNKVNATDCQTFNNGTFHQICVKIYGYEKDLGPTRVCLQLGAAIFNHGVASTDFGCFRFGAAVRHEEALEGEDPMPVLLNDYILQNDYNNILEPKYDPNNALSLSNNIVLTFTIYLLNLLVLR